jgi:hypothetical protein
MRTEIDKIDNNFVTFTSLGASHHSTFCRSCFLLANGCSGISHTGNNQALIDSSNFIVKNAINRNFETPCNILPLIRELDNK